jgi:serine/threonine-protein kinase RsbW
LIITEIILPDISYKKVIPSNPELLPEVEDFIINIAEENNISEDKFNALALSAAEAASNCILHGNKNDPNKMVEITVTVSNSKMVLIFKDEGKGFDPEAVPDPTKPENILKDSGRGIHIMKSYLTGVKYNFTPNGTEAILELDLS